MNGLEIFGLTALVAVALWLGSRFVPTRKIVRESFQGLLFRRGRLSAVVGPGRYWLFPDDALDLYDTRARDHVVSGQEVLTSDRVPIKISLVARFRVQDARKAYTETADYQLALYSSLQLALRDLVSSRELEVVLSSRDTLGEEILGAVAPSVADLGLVLESVAVRDFMMAGALRSAFAEVLLAKQQGLAALERARGEGAAVRSLANTARLVSQHPGLMQLRLLQAIESRDGNRLVVTVSPDEATGQVEVVDPEEAT